MTTLTNVIDNRRQSWLVMALAIGFTAALAVRILLGGQAVVRSTPAGLVFAGCLALLVIAAGGRAVFNRRVLAYGVAGGVFLCLPAAIMHFTEHSTFVSNGYLAWALPTAFVAAAEEAFLRGVLFTAVKEWRGDKWAVILPALAFAALHVPLYGWSAVPLDLAVGLWLGSLRLVSGSWVAPGIAHIIADLAGWWLR